MQAYRATFLKNVNIDYWKNESLQPESHYGFGDIHKYYYFIVQQIRNYAKSIEIKEIWCFYEPYVEITWISDNKKAERLYSGIEQILDRNNINDLEKSSNPDFADWYCESDLEREFGAKRHHLCSEFVELFKKYEESIEEGKGKRKQVERTIHTLCNPLGINYKEEAKICFSRGLICLLFTWFSFQKAVWIYTKIFRQEY